MNGLNVDDSNEIRWIRQAIEERNKHLERQNKLLELIYNELHLWRQSQ